MTNEQGELMTIVLLYGILGASVVALLLLRSSVRVLGVHERAVVSRLGRVVGARGPGLFFVAPVIDRVVKVDVQTSALAIPNQEVVTKDNVTLRLDAVAYIRVVDPVRALLDVDDYRSATYAAAQTAIRSTIGRFELDDLLADRDEVDQQLRKRVSLVVQEFGIEVKLIEMRDLQLPEGIRRAMGLQAQAEREMRAKVVYARGELEAAQSLLRTAGLLERQPVAMQLKVLSTLADLAGKPGSTLILPVPAELFNLVDRLSAGTEALNGRH